MTSPNLSSANPIPGPEFDREVTDGWICVHDGRFYVSPRCGLGHPHVAVTRTTTTTVEYEPRTATDG